MCTDLARTSFLEFPFIFRDQTTVIVSELNAVIKSIVNFSTNCVIILELENCIDNEQKETLFHMNIDGICKTFSMIFPQFCKQLNQESIFCCRVHIMRIRNTHSNA